jgi:hypothetical protein
MPLKVNVANSSIHYSITFLFTFSLQMWSIVRFPKEHNRVALVPQLWLTDDSSECWWPAISKQELFDEAVRKLVEPGSPPGWKRHPVVVMAPAVGE